MGNLMTPVFLGWNIGWKAPTKNLRLLKTFVILDFVEMSFPTKHIPQNWQLRWVQSLWTGHTQSNLNKKITNLHQLSNLKIHRIFGKKDQINQRRLVRKRHSKTTSLHPKMTPPTNNQHHSKSQRYEQKYTKFQHSWKNVYLIFPSVPTKLGPLRKLHRRRPACLLIVLISFS